ncbi:hypothetical protein Tco_0919877, partial [Tanacetum coccineum]
MSASGSHLLTWMPRGLPRHSRLANQRSPRGGGAATNNDYKYEVKWRLSNQVMIYGADSGGCMRFSIVVSSLVPWIYLGQFWHTLQEDGSKNKLKFMLDRKELTLTRDDFRTIFHLPQATDNNHDHFVPVLNFPEMNRGRHCARCLTTRVTGYDQPSLQIMQMLYCFVNNIRVDYAELLWEGFHYSLQNPTTMIPYPRFHKDYRKSKGVIGMKIPDWMITDEIKLTENYRLYAEVFGVDVPTTQSQPIESTQGTHRTASSPRTPNPEIAEDDLVLQETLQVSLAERHEDLEAKQNVENLKDHLMAEEIEKLVKGSKNVEKNVEVASSPLMNDDNQTNPNTRLEPMSDKESPEVEKIADISQHVNVNEEEEESAEDDYELRRR